MTAAGAIGAAAMAGARRICCIVTVMHPESQPCRA